MAKLPPFPILVVHLRCSAGVINQVEVVPMNTQMTEIATDLLQARARLALIARMARLNLERYPDQREFNEVMETILATCGTHREH